MWWHLRQAPAISAENKRRRNRRALGDANDPNLLDDVEDATSTLRLKTWFLQQL